MAIRQAENTSDLDSIENALSGLTCLSVVVVVDFADQFWKVRLTPASQSATKDIDDYRKLQSLSFNDKPLRASARAYNNELGNDEMDC